MHCQVNLAVCLIFFFLSILLNWEFLFEKTSNESAHQIVFDSWRRYMIDSSQVYGHFLSKSNHFCAEGAFFKRRKITVKKKDRQVICDTKNCWGAWLQSKFEMKYIDIAIKIHWSEKWIHLYPWYILYV